MWKVTFAGFLNSRGHLVGSMLCRILKLYLGGSVLADTKTAALGECFIVLAFQAQGPELEPPDHP